MLLYFAIFGIFGLIVGSFLNVVVYRLKKAETLLGRSYCRNCQHQIRWYDNVPLLSFLILRGSCRDCGERISWQYPLLEGLSGFLYGLLGALFFASSDGFYVVWLLGIIPVLLTIAFYDARYLEIPLVLLVIGLVWSVVWLFFVYPIVPFSWASDLMLHVWGGLAVAFFFFALVYASRETWMGWGDVWLGLMGGLIVGLPLALIMLTLSFGIGALSGMLMMWKQGKSLKTQVPFAPFLVSGILITVFASRLFPAMTQLFTFGS